MDLRISSEITVIFVTLEDGKFSWLGLGGLLKG